MEEILRTLDMVVKSMRPLMLVFVQLEDVKQYHQLRTHPSLLSSNK